MRAMTQRIALGALVLLLAACGSSPKVSYFGLYPSVTRQGAGPGEPITMALGPLRMPEYLNRSQLVTRGPGTEVQVDEFSRWAEPLEESIHRVVATDVDNLLDTVAVVSFPHHAVMREHMDYRLVGDIHRFDADHSGRVRLNVQWAVATAQGTVTVSPRRSQYETTAASTDSKSAIVAAMNDALSRFSRDIAAEMKVVLNEENRKQ